jgi:hypothetical protein
MLSPTLYVKARGREEYLVVHSVKPLELRNLNKDDVHRPYVFTAMDACEWRPCDDHPVFYVKSIHSDKYHEFIEMVRPFVKFRSSKGNRTSIHTCEFYNTATGKD